jgi:hypothetical protein
MQYVIFNYFKYIVGLFINLSNIQLFSIFKRLFLMKESSKNITSTSNDPQERFRSISNKRTYSLAKVPKLFNEKLAFMDSNIQK